MQLTQQVAQLALMANNPTVVYQTTPPTVPAQSTVHAAASTANNAPQEVDPLLNRLSQFLDDF